MEYKCRFCGYRFRDKDEQICPECLTARSEDISCSSFGEDVHSHQRYGDAPSSVFSRSDTFKDGSDSFLAEERREESHTSASKYEKQEARQEEFKRRREAVMAARAARSQPGAAPSPGGAYVPPSGMQGTMVSGGRVYPTAGPAYRPPQGRKKSGCGAYSFIVFFITIFMVFPMLSSLIGRINTMSENSDRETNEYTVTNTEVSEPEQEDFSTFSSREFDSNDGIYKVTQEYCSADNDLVTYVPSSDAASLFYVDDDGNSLLYDESLGLEYYKIFSRYSIYLNDSYGSDDPVITDVTCYGLGNDGTTRSYYTVPDPMSGDDGFMGSKHSITPILYCAKDCEIIEVYITVECGGKEQSFTFTLNKNEDGIENDAEDATEDDVAEISPEDEYEY